MVTIKLIFMVLAISGFVVNMQINEDWRYDQLMMVGGFQESHTKTEAYVYAFDNLAFPDEEIYNLSGYLFDYHNEILKRFLGAHINNLKYIFKDPITWCNDNIHNFMDTNGVKDFDEICRARMNDRRKLLFGETQCDALTNSFLRMRYYRNTLHLNKISTAYYAYIKERTKHFVDFTSARSPSDYCNNIESRPAYIVVFNQDGKYGIRSNLLYNQSYERPTSVHQTTPTFHNFFEQPASSWDVGKGKGKGLNIDLNELPSGEDEEI